MKNAPEPLALRIDRAALRQAVVTRALIRRFERLRTTPNAASAPPERTDPR